MQIALNAFGCIKELEIDDTSSINTRIALPHFDKRMSWSTEPKVGEITEINLSKCHTAYFEFFGDFNEKYMRIYYFTHIE